MHRILVTSLLCLTALSGCISDADGDTGDDTPTDSDIDGDGFTDAQEEQHGTDPADAGSVPTPPEPLQFEGTLYGAGEGIIVTSATTGCAAHDSEAALEEDPGCAVHTIDVPTPGWTVTFALTPGSGTVTGSPDYDLYILDADGTELGDSTNPGGEVDSWSKKLAAGTYTAKVQAWNNQDAPYTLDVTFAF